MDLQKSAVAPTELAERMKGLYDPGALRPAAAGARREGGDGDLAAAQRIEARLPQIVHWSRSCVRPVVALARIPLSCLRGAEANGFPRQQRRRLHHIFRG